MGTHYNHLDEAILTSTHNPCFEQKYEKKISEFLSKNYQFFGGRILNRRVFVMERKESIRKKSIGKKVSLLSRKKSIRKKSISFNQIRL